jgi:hypothetical protein
MATETFKYFKFDPNLRSAYGGLAAQAFGDSKEISPRELTMRWVCKQFGLPAHGTRYLWEIGVATDTFLWAKVTDLFYSAVIPYLSATELATAQSSAPAGFAKQSVVAILQPNPSRTTLVVRGDSISDGVLTVAGNTKDTWYAQALSMVSGEVIVWDDSPNFNEGKSNTYQIVNMSLGSSSWANTVGQPAPDDANKATVYPRREDLAFAQRTQTLPLFGNRMKFLYALGTNDLAYDTSISAADAWARALARIQAFKAEFPNIMLGIATLIKRTESSTLNTRLGAFNALVRSNAATVGYAVLDLEAKTPECNITTGNTADTSIYADGIHPTTAGHTAIATAMKDDLLAFLNA